MFTYNWKQMLDQTKLCIAFLGTPYEADPKIQRLRVIVRKSYQIKRWVLFLLLTSYIMSITMAESLIIKQGKVEDIFMSIGFAMVMLIMYWQYFAYMRPSYASKVVALFNGMFEYEERNMGKCSYR